MGTKSLDICAHNGHIRRMNLQAYMRQNDLSPEDFGAKVGRSHWAVRKWMYGQRTPRAAEMRAIHDATGGLVTPNDFLASGQSGAPAEKGAAA
jgi:hypothetical protein